MKEIGQKDGLIDGQYYVYASGDFDEHVKRRLKFSYKEF